MIFIGLISLNIYALHLCSFILLPIQDRSAPNYSFIDQTAATQTTSKFCDIANSVKNCGRRSKRVSQWTETDTVVKALNIDSKWQRWRRFISYVKNKTNRDNYGDIISPEEEKNIEVSATRRNAAIFLTDYEEECAVNSDKNTTDLVIRDIDDNT